MAYQGTAQEDARNARLDICERKLNQNNKKRVTMDALDDQKPDFAGYVNLNIHVNASEV